MFMLENSLRRDFRILRITKTGEACYIIGVWLNKYIKRLHPQKTNKCSSSVG